MAKLDPGIRTIKYHGPVDVFGLYNLIVGWMGSKGCVVHNPTTKHKVTGGGLEYEYKLMCMKKEDEYHKLKMEAEFIIKDAKEVEVVRNGIKKKMLHGTLYVYVGGAVINDMQGLFVNSKFEVALGKFLNKYVTREKSEVYYTDRLDYKLIELQTEIKEFIGMNTKGNAFHDAW